MAPEMQNAIIRVRDISVQFGTTKVLDGLDLDVKRGEILGFVGPSGAGKSVLTRTIIGLVPKVSGSIEAPYVDPGCSCSVVSTFEGTLSGSTLTGTISARDSKTGQWNFSSFTVSKGGGGKR